MNNLATVEPNFIHKMLKIDRVVNGHIFVTENHNFQHCVGICLFVWCLTAFSAQIGYIVP